MKLKPIKPLQSSVRKLTSSVSINNGSGSTTSSRKTKKEKKKLSQNSDGCDPSAPINLLNTASKATVLAHSMNEQDEHKSKKKGKQIKNLFRRKQKDHVAEDIDASVSTPVMSNVSTNDEPTMEASKLNYTKEKVKRVSAIAKEQCSVAVEKTAATSKKVSKIAKEQCAVAAEKAAEKTAATRQRAKHVSSMAQEQCSVASKKTIVKITDLIHNKKTKQAMLTTTFTTSNQDGVEISLSSLPLSLQNERFKQLRDYRRAAGKKVSKVAQKLSSLRKSGEEGEDDHELLESEPVTETLQQPECPICFDGMSEHDLQHPLQCKTPQCQYNFCAACIQNLIQSSQDNYGLASDGSNQVKVHLNCPNCRDSLSHSLKRTLLLRLADDTSQQHRSQSQRTHKMMMLVADHLPFANQKSPLNEKQKLMQLDHLDMEIYRARAEEREYLQSYKPKTKEEEADDGLNRYQDFFAAPHGDLRFKRESSFLVNETTCFYIDTQVNLGGTNPARLRFQM